MIDFSKELNKEQLTVVQATEGKVACVAAAGSGKTRCIIYRIAYLLQNKLYPNMFENSGIIPDATIIKRLDYVLTNLHESHKKSVDSHQALNSVD